MKKILRTAVSGLGRIAWDFHLPQLCAHDGFHPVAVVDPCRERLAEAQARFHDALFFLGLCELSSGSGGKGTVDEPLSTRDVKIAGVTALFRTALANGHFVLSDILDRYAEAKREHPELLSK